MGEQAWYNGIPEHEYRNGISGSWMPKPYDNIFIGSDPRDGQTKDWADQFDAIVNVSCTEGALFEPSRPDQRTYWYPLNEGAEWSYAYFFMMFKIIDHHYRKWDKIYIHCHAGAYRSPSIFRNWLIACENKTLEEANTIERGEDRYKDDPSMKHYSVYQNYMLGNMPPNYQEFIERIRKEGITKAHFVEILCQPFPLNKDRQIRTKQERITLFNKLKYKFLKPFRAIRDKYKRLKDLYTIWKNDMIEMKPEKNWTVTAKDWHKASKRRPKLEKQKK